MSKIAKDIVEAVLEKPSFVKTVKVESPRSMGKWKRLLIRIGIKRAPKPIYATKELYITPAKIDTVYALSGLLHEASDIVKESATEHKTARELTPLLVRIIAIAVTNNGDEAPEWLLKAIGSQFTSAELNITAKEVYRRLDYENFFGTIISLKAANQIDIQVTDPRGQQSADS